MLLVQKIETPDGAMLTHSLDQRQKYVVFLCVHILFSFRDNSPVRLSYKKWHVVHFHSLDMRLCILSLLYSGGECFSLPCSCDAMLHIRHASLSNITIWAVENIFTKVHSRFVRCKWKGWRHTCYPACSWRTSAASWRALVW